VFNQLLRAISPFNTSHLAAPVINEERLCPPPHSAGVRTPADLGRRPRGSLFAPFVSWSVAAGNRHGWKASLPYGRRRGQGGRSANGSREANEASGGTTRTPHRRRPARQVLPLQDEAVRHAVAAAPRSALRWGHPDSSVGASKLSCTGFGVHGRLLRRELGRHSAGAGAPRPTARRRYTAANAATACCQLG
jgi:hypothetical protein